MMQDSMTAEMSQLNDLEHVLLSEETIASRVTELGARISKDYRGQELVLIGILKGGITFLADLSREISIPHEYDLVGAQSYKGGTRPTPDVAITKEIDLNVRGRHVLLIEDIYDTGNTLKTIHMMIIILCKVLIYSKRGNRQILTLFLG